MRNWTYAEVKTKVENDLHIQEDTIIGPEEMLGYYIEAIDEAESEIHKLGIEDEYFLKYAYLTLVVDETDIDLPADIYANKIRGVIYHNGSDIYEITRFRRTRRFLDIEHINQNASDMEYQYLLTNASTPDVSDATTGRKLVLVPASREDSTTNVKIWYIRNAGQPADVDDVTAVLDIPEFANFIIAFVKVRCVSVEGDPRYNDLIAELQAQRKLMIDTLTEMVPDDATTIEQDLTHYEEHS